MFYKFILLISPYLAIIYACSCLQSTQKGIYNRVDIVAHVFIRSKTNGSDSKIYYEIHYNETFKPQPPKNPHVIMPVPLPNRLVTESNSAACGVDNLEIDHEYLISGWRQNNSISINSCSLILPNDNQSGSPAEWSSIDKDLLSKLRSGFQ